MNKVKDLTGQRFGRLSVLKRDESSPAGQSKWICQCDCGNIVTVSRNHLISSNTISCGCARKGTNTRDITGQRFGRLIAVSRTEKKSGNVYIYECKCDCGNTCFISGTSLRMGVVKSCGCYASEVHTSSISKAYEKRKPFLVDGTDITSISSTKLSTRNTSGCRGVSWDSSVNVWKAHITFQGKRYFLGSSSDYETAVQYRKKAEKEKYGNFLKWYYENQPIKKEFK